MDGGPAGGGMVAAINDMLPLAMAVALSPFPIVAIVLVLGARAGLRAGVAFSAGWLLGLGSLGALLLIAAARGPGSDDPIGGFVPIGIGLALFAGAWRKWRTRPRAAEPPRVPGWMASLNEISAGRAALIGAGLGGLNPKNIGLVFAATVSIAGNGLSRHEAIACLAAFILLGSVTVLGALVARALGGQRAAAPLEAVKQFMLANNNVIMITVFLLIGAKLIGEGLASLSG